jgi:hypothetical protein
MSIIMGIFLIVHGLVHLLYAGQSVRLFELRPGMTWPDGSWVFSRLLASQTTRLMAAVSLALITLSFIAAGAGVFIQLDWWRMLAAGAALFSTALFFLLWDGKFRSLDDQGGIGILINLAILAVVLFVKGSL